MAVRMQTSLALLAMAALVACGGGGGDSDSNGGSTDGLPDPGDIAGADPDFVNALNQQIAIANSDLALAGRTDLPTQGSATYSGFGSIFDGSLTTAANTVADLQNRAVVSTVDASVSFAGGTVDVTQTDFIDVEGNPVSGSVAWTGTYETDGRFNATVTGDVGGTTIATGTDQALVGFFGDQADSSILGLFENATTSGNGWLEGSSASGSFAATSD